MAANYHDLVYSLRDPFTYGGSGLDAADRAALEDIIAFCQRHRDTQPSGNATPSEIFAEKYEMPPGIFRKWEMPRKIPAPGTWDENELQEAVYDWRCLAEGLEIRSKREMSPALTEFLTDLIKSVKGERLAFLNQIWTGILERDQDGSGLAENLPDGCQNNADMMNHLIHGCLSHFNADDIEFYLKCQMAGPGFPGGKHAYTEYAKQMSTIYGVREDMESEFSVWEPSPKTAQQIITQWKSSGIIL